MKISTFKQAAGPGNKTDLNSVKNVRKGAVKNAVDKFEPAGKSGPQIITYSKESVKADSTLIAGLKAESERAFEFLRRIVAELLEEQGASAQGLKAKGFKSPGTDRDVRAEAAALVADDGPLGAEAVSKRIVDFALSISGGDKSRLPEIRRAIEQGFAQAKHALGGLPEVSQRTHDLVMEKLNQWEEAE